MELADARSRLVATRFEALRWVAETGSTNTDLMDAAARGAADGTVLVADHQSAGRGRRGRSFEVPPQAGLLISVLLRPRLPVERVHLLTMAVALSGSDAVQRASTVAPGLKWPNDLVVTTPDGDRKLAGILADSSILNSRVEVVVAGMGLNVNWGGRWPAGLAGSAIAVDELAGNSVDRMELLVDYLLALEPRLSQLENDGGVELLDEYRQRSATIGRRVRVELPRSDLVGTAVDVDDSGSLIVESDGRRTVVTVGDVVHLRSDL
ncbi:MAG: biotin--[acetyl-CoA-carboxylase] ligase [Actinomycetia bacterium]|nr:biotin--[acetyl-CoA-carboxylase] ligase [Actinomycetes bacterium]